MTETPSLPTLSFAEAARRLQRRLVLRKTLHHLRRTWPGAASALVVLAVLRLVGQGWAGVMAGAVVLLLWAGGCLAWSWRKMPNPYAALSFWDRQSSRSDAFANAWWFERQATLSEGQGLHLRRELSRLPEAMPSMARDLPLPDARWLSLLVLGAAALFFVPQGPGGALPDPELTEEGRRLAAQQGRELAVKKLDPDQMDALKEEEKDELEALQQKVQETAKSLQQEKAKTAREVLSELEKRARDAERLAAKLGAGEDAWASEQMVAEMRKHADTAELGDAVAGKSAEKTAVSAEGLAKKLQDPKLTHETRDRFAETLADIGKQAQPGDDTRTVGQHVLGADKNLSQTLPQEAAAEFQTLADKMKTLAAREKAREELEKLAQQLRQSGSDIAGQGGQGMKQLAGSQEQAGQSAPNQPGQQGQQGQQMQPMQNAPQMQPMQMPGLSNAPMQPGQNQNQQGQQGQQAMQMSPVPGTGQPMALAPNSGQPNSGQNNNGKPMLFAPVPGAPPGGPPAGAALLGGSMPGGNQGGLQAGSGTTPMGNSPTAQTKAGQQATVDAQRNAEGTSTVRSVEGQARAEAASRGPQATALEAIAAEENALDDQALPPARREQIRRYFTELRKRFEKEN